MSDSEKPNKPVVPINPFAGIHAFALVSGVAWQVAGPLLLFAVGGALLGQKLGLVLPFLLAGTALAIAVSWVLVRGTVRRIQATLPPPPPKGEDKP